MKNSLKFSARNHKLLFVSDLHIGHDPKNWKTPTPYESRGFKTAREFELWVYSEWHRLVDDNTIVFNIGDSNFNDSVGANFMVLSNLPCYAHYLLNGNHLSGAKQIFKNEVKALGLNDGLEVYPVKKNNLTFVGENLQVYIDGQSVYMQHYAPFIWPDCSKGGFAICGHSHGNCKEINVDNTDFGKILDVGVDNAVKYNGTPFFTWNEIIAIMKNKKVRISDHH